MDSDGIGEGRNDEEMRKLQATMGRQVKARQHQEVEIEVETAGEDDAERGAVPAVEDFNDEEWEEIDCNVAHRLWVPRVTRDDARSCWVVLGPILSGRYYGDPDPDLAWLETRFSDKSRADAYAKVLEWFFERELQHVPSVETLDDLRRYQAGTGPYAHVTQDVSAVPKPRRADWAKNGF